MDPSRTIVVVDDDPDALQFASRALEAHDYVVLKAGIWTEALDALHQGCPDLVLLDLHLPGIGGDALLEHVREEHPGVPVVIASSDIDGTAMEALGAMGARGFIRKPYETDDLLVVVEQVLLQSGGLADVSMPTSSPTENSEVAPRVAPGSGVNTLTRDRMPSIAPPPKTRERRFRKRRSGSLRQIRDYFLVCILFAVIGAAFWYIQQSFSGGFLGIGITTETIE